MSTSALQAAAVSRKAKLAALKKRKDLHDSASTDTDAAPPSTKSEVFRFRNYDPETGSARKHARLDEEDTVEKQVEGLAERVIAEDELRRAQELDITNIQPKKPNWDLKRDLDRKLAKLKGKTDMAVSTLIRKRLQAENGGEAAAAGMVAAQGEGEEDMIDSDEE